MVSMQLFATVTFIDEIKARVPSYTNEFTDCMGCSVPPPPLPLMTSADNLLPGKCVNIKLFHTFMIPVELKKKIK